MQIDSLFNIFGLVVALGASIIVAKTALAWRGVLRDGILFFLYGFIFFAIGFLWNIFVGLGKLPDTNIVFFAFGVTLALFGARRIFSFTDANVPFHQ